MCVYIKKYCSFAVCIMTNQAEKSVCDENVNIYFHINVRKYQKFRYAIPFISETYYKLNEGVSSPNIFSMASQINVCVFELECLFLGFYPLGFCEMIFYQFLNIMRGV